MIIRSGIGKKTPHLTKELAGPQIISIFHRELQMPPQTGSKQPFSFSDRKPPF